MKIWLWALKRPMHKGKIKVLPNYSLFVLKITAILYQKQSFIIFYFKKYFYMSCQETCTQPNSHKNTGATPQVHFVWQVNVLIPDRQLLNSLIMILILSSVPSKRTSNRLLYPQIVHLSYMPWKTPRGANTVNSREYSSWMTLPVFLQMA